MYYGRSSDEIFEQSGICKASSVLVLKYPYLFIQFVIRQIKLSGHKLLIFNIGFIRKLIGYVMDFEFIAKLQSFIYVFKA